MVEESISSSPRASDADDVVSDGSPPSTRAMVSRVGDRRCSVDVLAPSVLCAAEPPPRVEDMDDRCWCWTVLIADRGEVVPREVDDLTTAVWGGQAIPLLACESASRIGSISGT